MTDPTPTGGRDVHTVTFPGGTPAAELDVLIVGAGPVGLGAAVELTGRGLRTAVIDRAREATLVRAGAMGHTARVVEHLRRWQLLQRVRDAWTYPPEWHRGIRLVTSLAGHELVPTPRTRFTDRAGGTGPSSEEALRRPQTVFQRVFLDRLAELGTGVHGGQELTALREHADGVEAEVTDVATGTTRTVRAAYVLGTDGARSTTRRLAGIGREGEYATEKRLRLIVRTGDISDRVGPAPSATNIVFNDRASGFLAAVSTREWRVYAGPYPLDHEPDEKELLEVAKAAFGFDLDLELVSATTFHHATLIAETFRRGRILLAGDAAHVRTPGGNLGEGLGDVVNLGWKLAAVVAGQAPATLLDSYDEERRPHNHRVADHSLRRARRAQAALAGIRAGGIPEDDDPSPGAARRRAEIGEVLGRDRGTGAGVTFDERYDASSAVWYDPGQAGTERPWDADVYEDDPRPGHRAPDGPVDPSGGTLYDRLGDSFGLLVLGEDREAEHALTAEAAARGIPYTVVHLTDPAARTVYGTPYVLVRPDQHVVWRGDRLPPGGATAVWDRVLGAAQHVGAAVEFGTLSAAVPSPAPPVGAAAPAPSSAGV